MIAKVKISHLLITVVVGLGLCFLFGVFGKREHAACHNTLGTIRVGEGLEQANDNQQIIEERIGSAATRIERIESSVTNSQGRIGNAQKRTGNIESLVVESEEIARTDGRILQAIKERAKAGDGSQGQ